MSHLVAPAAAADPLLLLLGVLDALPPDADLAVVRDDARWVVGVHPDDVVTARGAACFPVLDGLAPGWWAGFLSYDLGRAVERFPSRAPDDLALPDLALASSRGGSRDRGRLGPGR